MKHEEDLDEVYIIKNDSFYTFIQDNDQTHTFKAG